MAKTITPPVNPPAPASGEVKPPETSTQPPAQDPTQGPTNPPEGDPGATPPDPTPDAPKPSDPAPNTSTSKAPTFRYRVNWRLSGFRKEELIAGDTVLATEEEAAPYLGGVLTLDEAEDED